MPSVLTPNACKKRSNRENPPCWTQNDLLVGLEPFFTNGFKPVLNCGVGYGLVWFGLFSYTVWFGLVWTHKLVGRIGLDWIYTCYGLVWIGSWFSPHWQVYPRPPPARTLPLRPLLPFCSLEINLVLLWVLSSRLEMPSSYRIMKLGNKRLAIWMERTVCEL